MDKQERRAQGGGSEEEGQAQGEGQNSNQRQKEGSDPLETLVSLLSALLLSGAVGFLA